MIFMAVIYPLLSEKAVGLIEKQNKIVFIVDSSTTKADIKKAMEDLYKVKVAQVNTLNSMKGKKKAYIQLKPEFKATDLAAKLKIL